MSKDTIYFASPLFNFWDQAGNFLIASELENRDFEVILPQRDGFEFSRLDFALKELGVLNLGERETIREDLIYLLDIGYFLGIKSDVALIRFDEVDDKGVSEEAGFCKWNNIPFVNLRTDCRRPYGLETEFKGGHFFQAYSGPVVYISSGISNQDNLQEHLKEIGNQLEHSFKGLSERGDLSERGKRIVDLSEKIFGKDFSNKEVEKVCERYFQLKNKIRDFKRGY